MTPNFSPEPQEARLFTARFDQFYSRFAVAYHLLVKYFPPWRRWLDITLPWIQGPKVLEVSFGTGYLLTKLAGQFDTHGIDLNQELTAIARSNLLGMNLDAHLQRADVECIPFASGTFDSIVNTMAFTAYPDGRRALAEITRVLKSGGRLVMLDINFPSDNNRIGTLLARGWQAGGDIIRDMPGLFEAYGYQFTESEVGGFGCVHLYVAIKMDQDST